MASSEVRFPRVAAIQLRPPGNSKGVDTDAVRVYAGRDSLLDMSMRRTTKREGGVEMRMRMIAVLATVAMAGFLTAARAEEKKPDARIELSGGSVAVGVGYSWAGGTLTYQGKKYEVEVKGLSVGDVGITKAEAAGDVYNLNKLSDFDGNYTAAAAGATVAGGAGASIMRNQNGVEIRLVATTQGLKFTFAAEGVSMKIKK
jgi:hypothetical protein